LLQTSLCRRALVHQVRQEIRDEKSLAQLYKETVLSHFNQVRTGVKIFEVKKKALHTWFN
jgi:hypothetical protein